MTSDLIPDSPSASPRFDILTGAKSVEDALKAIAEQRTKMSTAELGTMAGIGVLDQFRLAKAETNIRWWKDPALALSSFYALLAVGVPALGFVAGIAIDVAIFGGAAKDLSQISKLYYALSAGSLVFAVGIGIAKNHRTLLLVLALVACLGASFVPADQPDFRQHFANLLPWLKGPETNANERVAKLQESVEDLTNQNKDLWTKLHTGGIGNLPMLQDGNTSNDIQANQYIAQMSENEKLKRTEQIDLAAAKEEAKRASQDNWAQHFGRVFGALYMFVWLLASQLVVARVIKRGPRILREQQQRSSIHRAKALFVRQLEDPNLENSGRLATAAVSDLLMRFNRILAYTGEAKQQTHQLLFEDDSLRKMQKIGVDLVCGAVTPRKGWTGNATTNRTRAAGA